MDKSDQYQMVLGNLRRLMADESDEIAALATVVCELHWGMQYDWTGFYRVVSPGLLKIGPYQGTHGCLVIPFHRGVCGQCARQAKTQIVPDVTAVPHHIACSAATRSEIVVPVFNSSGEVRAVLDVDSNSLNAFDEVDAQHLEEVCRWLTRFYDRTLDHS
jgi:L-methionine (R)-S-oxide reductase